MAEIENELDLTSGSRTTKKGDVETKETFKSPSYLFDVAKLLEKGIVDLTHELTQPLKQGIVAGVSNIPLSLQSLNHYVDILHGGAYSVPTYLTPFYNPGVQQQIGWQLTPLGTIITGNLGGVTLVDITPTFDITIILGVPIITVNHPNPTWVGLPGGAKPEQAEAIINSGIPHVLPKLISDYDYFLGKEWSSLFFGQALVSSALTSFSTNIRTLAQAADSGGKVIEKAAEELG